MRCSSGRSFTGFLAVKLGLSIAKAVPTDEYILLERYDRRYQDGSPVRLHQEDLCQALGIPPFRKYQREGGVGFARVVDLIREHSATPLHDLRSLVTWQLANLILGNADGHVKNVSLLYDGRQRTLAPFYDMVCTRVYDGIDRHLAMSIGTATDPGQIGRRQLHEFAREIGMGAKYIVGELDRIMTSLEQGLDDYAHEFSTDWGENPVIDRVCRTIRRQIRRTRTLTGCGLCR